MHEDEKCKRSEKTKIIVITSFVDAMEAIKARRMGADDYIVKTEDFLNLIDSIKKQLEENQVL